MMQHETMENAMPFVKGKSGNPKGRVKGPIKKKLRDSAAEVLVLTGEQPGHFLARIMSDPATPQNVQVEAAKALMPYLHKKKPEAREVEVTGLPDTIHFVFE